jgi:arsenate reductase
MKKILIFSNKNAARSQMMQGWLAYYLKDKAEVISAGKHIESIHMLAQKAMMESVIDINAFKSKNISDYNHEVFDYVIIVDESTTDSIIFTHEPGEIITHPFKDPGLADGTDIEKLKAYREVCNEIEDYAMEFAMKHFNLFQ